MIDSRGKPPQFLLQIAGQPGSGRNTIAHLIGQGTGTDCVTDSASSPNPTSKRRRTRESQCGPQEPYLRRDTLQALELALDYLA